ncbi:hypothetical protein AJ79_08252 [Helicocarpus griseus UAMH5409]|uniref:Lactamase-like protein nscB n=1 Tax=Helicocarpus griseus UAMH5409 TaxID=1447875 RepID=A0A2B7WUY5_9EURO|nr:hypothetical protein AJ79_08252 [Helicocarpus griseus UAMH5409]
MAAAPRSLPAVERLSGSVIRLLAGNPGKFTLQGTNTYLVGRGAQRLLIDTGEGRPSWSAALKAILAAEKATVHQVLLTHWHGDHVGGVLDLLKLCPRAKVYKYDGDGNELAIEDGQVFRVEGATLRAIYTPGHTADHMAFLLEEENALFTGDNVLGHGTAVFEDLSAYMTTLEKMRKLGTKRAYPGHGAVIEDSAAKIAEYIQHRRQREEEVLRVLKFGGLDAGPAAQRKEPTPLSPQDLAAIIYPGVAEELRFPAMYGLVQVLAKLEEEGKVVGEEGGTGRWIVVGGRASL